MAGNVTNINGVIRTYNEANQMTNDGTNTITFDDNGNMTSDGVNSYTWDRANRLLSHAGTTYKYDGNSNRISQTVSSVVTEYLVDTQPALSKVLRESDSTNTTHFVHAPRGIHAMEDNSGNWIYPAQDGLGSVRAEVNSSGIIAASQNHGPFGGLESSNGSFASPFGFTGEQTDDNGQVYLRARHYNPVTGIFTSLDPFEGLHNRPMSLNGYSWVEGNVPNWTDASGLFPWLLAGACIAIPFLLGGSVAPPPRTLPSGRCKVFMTGLYGATGTIWEEAFPTVIVHNGNKLDQAQRAVTETTHCDDVAVVGYSAGGDSALIFARLVPDRIRGLALLGPTLTGAEGTEYDVSKTWNHTLIYLDVNQIPVYVLNDSSTPENRARWSLLATVMDSVYFKYEDQSERQHFDREGQDSIGTYTNNDPALVREVSEWIIR